MPRRQDRAKFGRQAWRTRKQRKRQGQSNEARHARLKKEIG